MNKITTLFATVALLATAACSNKGVEATEEANAVAAADEAHPELLYAPVSTDGKVIKLNDPTLIKPGVAVEQLTVIDFNAVWCGPCRQLKPVFEEMAAKYAGKVTMISVDVDTYPELFTEYNVGQAIPAVVFLRPDGNRKVFVGINDLLPADKFEKIINDNL